MKNLIRELANQGINISLFGDNLKLKPAEIVTDEIIRTVKTNKAEIMDELKSKHVCYCCGKQSFWRKKRETPGRWICANCHDPHAGLSRNEIEWLQ